MGVRRAFGSRVIRGGGLVALAMVMAAGAMSPAGAGESLSRPHSPGQPYAARSLPDRVVLTPGASAARQMAVAWRTDAGQSVAQAQIAPALDGPSLEARARQVIGVSAPITTENGAAIYHQARFDNLDPDTAYVYRVRGSAGWSEWFQFRTAADGFKPFSFIYLGDTQNNILSIASRV